MPRPGVGGRPELSWIAPPPERDLGAHGRAQMACSDTVGRSSWFDSAAANEWVPQQLTLIPDNLTTWVGLVYFAAHRRRARAIIANYVACEPIPRKDVVSELFAPSFHILDDKLIRKLKIQCHDGEL